jgi:hypothetical protein
MTTFYDEVTTACDDWYQGWINISNDEREIDLKRHALLLGPMLCTNPVTAPFGFALLMNHFSTDIKEFFAPITEFFKEWYSGWKDILNTEIDFNGIFNRLEQISSSALEEINNNQVGSGPR